MYTIKNIQEKIEQAKFTVFTLSSTSPRVMKTTYILLGLFFMGFAFLFLPWTQNTSGYGKLTTVSAKERPQDINALIEARIKKWYVSEGRIVKKGDTLVELEEIKDYYLDPQLVDRNRQMVVLKKEAVLSYQSKVKALKELLEILKNNKKIKINQVENKRNSYMLKYKNDSALYLAYKQAFSVAEAQYNRAKEMRDKGMIAQYSFENRTVKFQEKKAKLLAAYNKIQAALNDVSIAENEIENVANTFNEKIAKASSNLYSAQIALIKAKNELVKQENMLTNLEFRSKMHYVLAPQNGFISITSSSGVGEVVKKGKPLIKIVPSQQYLAAEIFIRPIDIPLLRKNQEVRLVFDGWPSIVFSGWPGASVGTFSARIFSIDRDISSNGKYRVLVIQSENEPWPDLLQVGSGVQAYALLSDVKIWYELWRQLNGFPANFYKDDNDKKGYTK